MIQRKALNAMSLTCCMAGLTPQLLGWGCCWCCMPTWFKLNTDVLIFLGGRGPASCVVAVGGYWRLKEPKPFCMGINCWLKFCCMSNGGRFGKLLMPDDTLPERNLASRGSVHCACGFNILLGLWSCRVDYKQNTWITQLRNELDSFHVNTCESIVEDTLALRLLSPSDFIVSWCCRYLCCNRVILSSVAAVLFCIFSIVTDGAFRMLSKMDCFGWKSGLFLLHDVAVTNKRVLSEGEWCMHLNFTHDLGHPEVAADCY